MLSWDRAVVDTGSSTANPEPHGSSMVAHVIAVICLTWYVAVAVVCAVGYVQLRRYYSSPPRPAICTSSSAATDVPHVTVIRPVKGREPNLKECLEATFQQTYPREKLTVYFCISSRDDLALPILERLLAEYPLFDATITVEEEDPQLQEKNGQESNFGPNPKIRNMSRAYREAKGDIVWIIDCNVWVGKGVCSRMVDTLCGYDKTRKNKFVHQLPLIVNIVGGPDGFGGEHQGLLRTSDDEGRQVASTSTEHFETRSSNRVAPSGSLSRILQLGGGRLEEVFMSSSHAKFYTAINTVLIAPCIVGKSNMFWRSHLNALTNGQGIDYFSVNICEDHLIGDLLWRSPVPAALLEKPGEEWGNHALVFGDLAIQPMANFSIKEYIARRVRWLRVRKFTVTLATLVEPGTESFLCSAYGAFAVTTLSWFHETLGMPQTWVTAVLFWLLSVSIWAAMDYTLYKRLHSMASIEFDQDITPLFVRRKSNKPTATGWLLAWLGREALAFPVWAWAVLGGVTVTWRGKKFWVGMDMKVHEIRKEGNAHDPGLKANGVDALDRSKARRS